MDVNDLITYYFILLLHKLVIFIEAMLRIFSFSINKLNQVNDTHLYNIREHIE